MLVRHLLVIPAQAALQAVRADVPVALDPRFRGGDVIVVVR